MRDLDGRTFLSASDLMRFMGCAHATALDMEHMRGTGPTPRQDTEDTALLQKQGDAHEAAHLARLRDAGHSILEIEQGKLANNAEETKAALAAGPDVVFQGAFCRVTGAASQTSSSVSRRPPRSGRLATRWPTPN